MIFLTVFYSGTLTAYMAIPIFENPIDSLEDLALAAKEGGFGPMVVKGSSNELIFKVNNEIVLQYFHVFI